MTPEDVTSSGQYYCLKETQVKADITIYSAQADGASRTLLKKLQKAGAATEAHVYIYAAMKQVTNCVTWNCVTCRIQSLL